MMSDTKWYRVCPVCGQKNNDTLYYNDLAVLDDFDMSYRVTYCDGCYFIYANVLPEPQQYDEYYRLLSKYDVISNVQSVPAVDQFRTQSAVAFCQPYLKGDATIADLGCGSGVLLNAFQQANWSNLYGLDPAPNAHTKAQTMFSLFNVYTGTLNQASEKLPLTQVDLVCLMGVLEHLPMLKENLAELVGHLSVEVKIMIEVPALERFDRDEFEPYGEFSLEHIQFFSAKTLAKLMESLGFFPINISYLELPKGSTDSLLCLFGRQAQKKFFEYEQEGIAPYLNQSKTMMDSAINTILGCESEQLIIYGAGSHTARLIPKLRGAGLSEKLLCLVDSNINLQGKSMGGLTIRSPDELEKYPHYTIIISSFRSQQNIAETLKSKYPNPLLLLY